MTAAVETSQRAVLKKKSNGAPVSHPERSRTEDLCDILILFRKRRDDNFQKKGCPPSCPTTIHNQTRSHWTLHSRSS